MSSTRLVFLRSVRNAFEANDIPFEECKDWSDEEVVSKLLQLLREKPKTRPPSEGGVRLPEWLAKHLTDEEEEKKETVELINWRNHFVPLADALGDCRASKAVEPISKGLGSPDEYVVEAAARALGKIGDASFVDGIKPFLSHGEKRVRFAAAEGLARLGLKEGFDALRRFMREEEEWREERFQVRDFLEIKCAKALYELGDTDGVEFLVKYLDHPSSLAVSLALTALEEIKAPECKQAVKEHISKESIKDNVLTCVRILADLGELSELRWVMKVLVEGKPSERRSAAKTCYQLGFTVFLKPLRKRLEVEGNKEVRETIERAIRRIDEDSVVVEGPPLDVEEPLELITRFGKRILQNPNDETAWERKAEEEVYYFTAQLERGGDRLEVLRRLGFAYLFGPFGPGRISKAEDCFKQVLAEKPDDPVALFGLARTQIGWRGGCTEERKSMLLRAKAGCERPFVNLYDWAGNDLEFWLSRCA